MISTFREYLTQPKALSPDTMHSIHEALLEDVGSDPDALELYHDLLAVSVKYAKIRAGWPLLTRSQKMDSDSDRTSCHDSVISHFNMLARYAKQQGKNAAWRDTLGYEEDAPYNRKAIGDFACYLAFVNALNAR